MDILQPPGQIESFNEVYILTELMQIDLHKIIVSQQPLTIDHCKVFLYQILRGTNGISRERESIQLLDVYLRIEISPFSGSHSSRFKTGKSLSQ